MSDEVPPRLVPGALETLAALTRLNVDLIVISATASVVVHGDLRALGLQRNFDFVFGGTPTKLSALRALTASGESRWLGYIGDTEHDVAAAQQAGMPSIAYAGGYRPRSALESVSPDFMLEHLAEVVPIVEAMLS
jgi:phosphoglycolate phosphatase-like HAD superfamily hydrolase